MNAYGRRLWRFRNRESGYEFEAHLHLLPEIEGSPMVGGLDTDDGTEQLAAFVHYVEQRMPKAWAADAVPILWFVESDAGQLSIAPYMERFDEDWTTEFTWPTDATTGELVDFFRLPVKMDRFPAFAKALSWIPASFTRAIPLRSRMASLRGTAPRPRFR